jgi:endonuclease YncB( thermonuclease family)
MEDPMKKLLSKVPLHRMSVVLLTLTVCASVFAQTVIFQGRVVGVTHGDTVTVLTPSNTEFQVRCRGIDAPKGEENLAYDSKQRLTDLLLDAPVKVTHGERNDDGILVGTILLNDRDICLEQVTAGMAWPDGNAEQSRSKRQQYDRAESVARSNRVGLWSVATSETGSQSAITVTNGTASPGPDASPGTSVARSSDTTVNVRGYFRKDGTYVAPHKRSAPDGNFDNNWSTQGNINPYTGQVGTKKRSRWITALKWVGIGATLGALMYLDARYPTPTARCNDGTYSYSRNRPGTCSYHRGVAYWLY